MGYIRPVPFTGLSTWTAHTLRTIPSSEPGTDYYCRIGTPVVSAAAGRVSDTGDSIHPATGRYVTVDLDDGRRVRYLHLSSRAVARGQRVTRGQRLGLSGASGYGEEDWSWNPATGGAHVHMTLWPTHAYHFGRYATLDPEKYMSETPTLAGGLDVKEFDDMATKQEIKDALYEVLTERPGLGPGNRNHWDSLSFLASMTAQAVTTAKGIKADLNYIHQVSPYSLKALLEASGRGEIVLSDEQVAAIGGQLSASAVAGIEAALADDFDGVKARLAELPKETIAALKAAL